MEKLETENSSLFIIITKLYSQCIATSLNLCLSDQLIEQLLQIECASLQLYITAKAIDMLLNLYAKILFVFEDIIIYN